MDICFVRCCSLRGTQKMNFSPHSPLEARMSRIARNQLYGQFCYKKKQKQKQKKKKNTKKSVPLSLGATKKSVPLSLGINNVLLTLLLAFAFSLSLFVCLRTRLYDTS